MYEDGQIIGDRFVQDVHDSETLEKYFKERIRGDKWGFTRTDILRQFPYPEPPGFFYVSEAVVWFAIGRRYKTRYVNDPLGINFETDPDEPRVTNLSVASAQGRLVFHHAVIEDYLDYAVRSPRIMLESLINYSRYSFIANIGPLGQLKRMRSVGRKLLVLATMPLGYGFYRRDRPRLRPG